MEYQPIAAIAAEPARASFTIEAVPLAAAVDYLAKRVTERRNTVPILSHLLIAADLAGSITITATDLDQEAIITLAAHVDEPGEFCTDAANLAAMLAKLKKGGRDVTMADDGDRVALKSGRNRFALPRLPVDDFPRIALGETLSRFAVAGTAFIADLAALAPAISREESRYYLNGVAMQIRNLAGQDRLAMAATDGQSIAVASRPIPAGAETLADSILPRKAVENLVRAVKLADSGEAIDVEFTASKMRFTVGNVTLTAKLVDGTFPDWEAPFAANLAPSDGEQAAMFPDLLPGANVAALAKLAKGAPSAITWQPARAGLVGTVAGDDGLLFGAMALGGDGCGRNGFAYQWNGKAEARAYLEALAASRGLPDAGEIEARCEAINAESANPTNAQYNGESPYARADFSKPRLIQHGTRIVGLTIEGTVNRYAWSETVTDWEALCERRVDHPATYEAIDGSYSILMPADGPGQLTAASAITGPDGIEYPVAMSESAIHLSKEQVRALIGESCFEVMAVPIPDSHPLYRTFRGYPAHVARWCYEQGDTRLLVVMKDGRCFDPKKWSRDYLMRDEIDALLAGTWEPESEAAYRATGRRPALPLVGGEPEPAAVEAGEAIAPQADEISEAESRAWLRNALADHFATVEPEPIAPELTSGASFKVQPTGKQYSDYLVASGRVDHGSPEPDLTARLAEIEARLAAIEATPLSAVSTGDAEWHCSKCGGNTHRSVSGPMPRDCWQDGCDGLAFFNPAQYVEATPIAERARRTAAHERAVRRAWAARAECRKAMACAERMAIEAKVQHKRADDLDGELATANRWKADYQAMANEALLSEGVTANRLKRSEAKRRRAVTLARHRGQQMSAMAVVARDRLATLSAELDTQRSTATYMDAAGREAPDIVSQTAHHARTAIDKVDGLERELSEARASIARMDAAIDGLGEHLVAATSRAIKAERALGAVTARRDGWPPAVQNVEVKFAA